MSYGRFLPQIILSNTIDYTGNSIPAPTAEDFEFTDVLRIDGMVCTGYDYEVASNWALVQRLGWTDNQALLRVTNQSSDKCWVYYNPADEGANYANATFTTIPPHQSCVIYIDSQYYGPLFGNSALASAILYIESGSASNNVIVDILLVGNNE